MFRRLVLVWLFSLSYTRGFLNISLEWQANDGALMSTVEVVRDGLPLDAGKVTVDAKSDDGRAFIA